MPGQAWLKDGWRYAAGVLLAAAAFALRAGLDPLFGATTFVYSVSYLAVVLAAYFAGPGPAALTSLLSGVLAYWAFAAPAFAFKINVEALTGMAFFGLTSAIDIYFINGMARALAQYRREHRRAEELADGNARMFKEFSERTTHHLQLVAALLQSRAGDAIDAVYRTALAEASVRTMAISRAHRALAEEAGTPVDFLPFARQLMAASIEAAALPDVVIDVSGEAIQLSSERATSTAVILLEWVRALLHDPARAKDAPMRLHVGREGDAYILRLAVTLPEGTDVRRRLDETSQRIVGAAIEQIHGRARHYRDAMHAVVQLSVPIEPPTPIEPRAEQAVSPSSLLH